MREHTSWRLVAAGVVTAAVLVGCAPVGATVEPGRTTQAARSTAPDTTALIPAGFGSLRQDDIAMRVTANGLTVRAIPLDENFIRTLSPDSYKTLHDLGESKRTDVADIVRRTGLSTVTLWYVSFFNLEQGEARFSPQEVVLTNQGRDFRPLDVIALTPGFGNQRLRQREIAHALYVFDGAVNPNQSLSMKIEGQSGGDWRPVVQRVERERALIRSRAASGTRPPPGS
jgi:hypothetical protein